MDIEWVLDASALCAFLLGEPGAAVVGSVLSASGISVVNLSEVYAVLIRRGVPPQRVPSAFSGLGVEVVPFDNYLAFECADLITATRPWGLSLGDRACLVSARHLSATAVTCNTAWSQLDIGIPIRLIR